MSDIFQRKERINKTKKRIIQIATLSRKFKPNNLPQKPLSMSNLNKILMKIKMGAKKNICEIISFEMNEIHYMCDPHLPIQQQQKIA